MNKYLKTIYLSFWKLDHYCFLFLQQNDSLIESAKKGDLFGVKDALSRGADVNTVDLVCLLNLF